jgi:ABC-type dipeptide/oligopeptide/nickel transport system permease subunit/ABC-type transport system substrate-binding protein
MTLFGAEVRARLRRDPAFVTGLALVLGLAAFALLGPLFVGADPNASHFGLARGTLGQPPGPQPGHPLGTDPLFRDLAARLAHGARLSLLVAIGATALALGLGTAVGITAGMCEGGRARWVDTALMRLVDVALAFPYLLLVTAVGVTLERTTAAAVVLTLGLTAWTGVARVVRAKVTELARREHVTAALALGATRARVLWRHLVPGLSGTLLVVGTHALPQMILAEAVLGYLTVGIEPPHASLGRMVHEAEHYLGLAPLVVAAPSLVLLTAVLGLTRLGDGLRDALAAREARAPAGPRRRFVPLDALVLVGALALAGFAAPEPPAPPAPPPADAAPARGGTLRLATSAPLHTLDPALAYDEGTRAVHEAVLARLVRYGPDGRPSPDLAERFEVRDGGRRLWFALRAGLRFHDGTALGASDVKRSLERTLHADTPCPAASSYAAVAGFGPFRARRADEIAGIRVLSDRELEIELSEPDASFLALLSMPFAAPVCASAGRVADPRARALPCAAGPFVVRAHEPEGLVRLERFERYHEPGRPLLDGIDWYAAVRHRSQRLRFAAGELDVVSELAGADVLLYAADARWAANRAWVSKAATFGLFMNVERPPLTNRHLRRAIGLAIDASVLSKVRETLEETDRLLPPALAPREGEPLRRHDRDAALAEMALAGYPFDAASGRGGYPDTLPLLAVPDSFDQAAGEIVQQQLARVGVRVRLDLVSTAAWLARMQRRGAAVMGFRGWQADFPDPSTFFDPILTTAAIRDEGSQNVSFFSSSDLDRVARAARAESDPGRRMALYAEAERIVRDEAPWVPLYVARTLHLWQSHVRAYRPHAVAAETYAGVWLAR